MSKKNNNYIPSERIKKQIIQWEGSSMKTNNSFENEAYYFNKYLKQAGILDQMSDDELDGLFSLSYNIGSTIFKNRTIPYLVKLYNGTGTVEDVLNHMYGDQDSKPHLVKGISKRRQYEKDLFTKGYNQRINKNKNKPKYSVYQQETAPVDNTRVALPPQLDLDQLLNNYPVTTQWKPDKTILDQYTEYWTNNVPQVEYQPLEVKTFNPIFSNRVFSIYYNGGKLLKKVGK